MRKKRLFVKLSSKMVRDNFKSHLDYIDQTGRVIVFYRFGKSYVIKRKKS